MAVRAADVQTAPGVAGVLARYSAAVNAPGAPEITSFESTGTIAGGQLEGSFHTWDAGDRDRSDESLGPRSDTLLRIGSRIWETDANGSVRELTGVLARRNRTQDFINSGEFAKRPEDSVYRGRTTLGGTKVDALDVTAPQGETETLYIDAVSGFPVRLAYDDDDGRTTIDLSDWREVQGHWFAYKNVESNGDHAFDVTQVTQTVVLGGTFADAVFAPLVLRAIAMSGPQTIGLDVHEGHVYAPVVIDGHKYNFLLDTGAQDIVVDRHVASDLGLNALGSLEASGATRTGGLHLVKLDEIDIGTGRLTGIVASSLDLGGSTSGVFRIDGILGYPFFAAATVKLDFAAKSMTFGPPGSVPGGGDKIPIDVDRSFPEATFTIDTTTRAPFIVDTGNAGEVLIYKPFLEKHAGIVPFSAANRSSYGIGGSAPSYRTALDSIALGSTVIYHAETDVMLSTSGAFADRFDAGNVGLGLLRNFVVTFDLSNAAMYLEHGSAFDDGRGRT